MEILSGRVLWLSDSDFLDFSLVDKIGVLFTGVKPLHKLKGNAVLTTDRIVLIADTEDELSINLKDITQLYMGFDEIYKPAYVKNFGTFWQPLRITYCGTDSVEKKIYLVIDHNFLSSGNQTWFNCLTEMLS
ncbi:hypothetical protein [Pedobacter heparinus]|uniref:hypothetical protein n=1 Tax=Pedobacter heparinus TaxID=984 RepID=UPI00292E9B6D|nr:hypothetical protein [Pedobacter heparinus]